MPLNPTQESILQQNLRIARILWGALSLGAPLVYLLIFCIRSLHGDATKFLIGLGKVPWHNPMVTILLILSTLTLLIAFILPDRIARTGQYETASAYAQLRVKLVITCSFLEFIAIFGLVLGFTLGSKLATLSLLLMLVPIAAGVFTFPSESTWRQRTENSQSPI